MIESLSSDSCKRNWSVGPLLIWPNITIGVNVTF